MIDIQAVIFDLYGTLIHLDCETKPYRRLFTDLGHKGNKYASWARKIVLTEDHENFINLVNRIKPDAKIDILSYSRELERELESASLYPETKIVLNKLRRQGVKLGLISNLASPYKKPFFDLGLNEYFDEVLFSCEIGLKKPDKLIYQKMIETLEINPSQALMAGDSVRSDVEGPKSIGMNAIHINRVYDSPNSIPTLDEIFQYL